MKKKTNLLRYQVMQHLDVTAGKAEPGWIDVNLEQITQGDQVRIARYDKQGNYVSTLQEGFAAGNITLELASTKELSAGKNAVKAIMEAAQKATDTEPLYSKSAQLTTLLNGLGWSRHDFRKHMGNSVTINRVTNWLSGANEVPDGILEFAKVTLQQKIYKAQKALELIGV